MHTEILSYEVDGLTMHSHLYISGTHSGPRPAVVVFPEGFGISDHAKGKAQRLAELGYVALCSDLHGNGRELSDLQELMGILSPLYAAPSRIRARAFAGLSALQQRPEVDRSRIAAIGYCFGGTMALELARDGGAIVGAAGFHSGLQTVAPAITGAIRARILTCIGADDPMIPAEQRVAFENEMRSAAADWEMQVYGGVVHSFSVPAADSRGMPEALRYDRRADERAWKTLVGFLDEVFV